MRRVGLIAALVLASACAAGPVEELLRSADVVWAPSSSDPEPSDGRPSGHKPSPHREIREALAVLVERLAVLERTRGFAEEVLGFAKSSRGPSWPRDAESVLRGCIHADEVIARAAVRAQEELEGEVALDVEQDAVHARDVILPLITARAAVFAASRREPSDRREELLRRARSVAQGIEPASAWAEAHRGAVIVGASYLLGDDKAAIAAADAVIRSVAEEDGSDTVPAGIALEAGIIATAASARSEGYEAARRWLARLERLNDSMPGQIGVRLALADAAFLVAKRGADEAVNERERVRLLSDAFNAYEPVVCWEDDREGERFWARYKAWEHAAFAVKTGAFPIAELPLIAATAEAQHTGKWTEAEHKRSRQIFGTLGRAMLRQSEEEVPRAILAEALEESARHGAWSADLELWREAPAIYLRLAKDFADQGKEVTALESAVVSASGLVEEYPEDAAARAVLIETLRQVHQWPQAPIDRDPARRMFIRALAEQAANDTDRDTAREAVAVAGAIENDTQARYAWTDACWAWNAVLERSGDQGDARALLSAVDQAEERIGEQTPALAVYEASALLAIGEVEDAAAIVDRVEAIWRDDPALVADGLEASVRVRVAVGDRDGALASARTLKRADARRAGAIVSELAERAWGQIEPLTQRLDPCPNGQPCATPAQVTALWLTRAADLGRWGDGREGWAFLLAGKPGDALEAFRFVTTGDLLMRQQLGEAEALFATGQNEAAFAKYRQIADDTAFSEPGGRDFWRAWTRMLEILARQNTDGSRTAEIEREIARLRVMPSAPDHPDCLARLAEIEKSLNRAPAR